MKSITLILLALIASTALSQSAATQTTAEKEPRAFSKVTRVGDDSLRSFFMFALSDHDYTIRADGFCERSLTKARARNFNLKVDQRHIEQVYFLEHEGDLLLIYQLSDEHIVRGYAIRLNQATLKPLWLVPVNELELEGAQVEAGYLKLKGATAVAKIDLRSGTFVEN